ncbi:cytochrome P450 [Hypoxylon trugodes]|uniref:cytochrome P450 n=1 Tax=Hypoxylon trugodes TaxID=326681 RepID=UPI0021A0E7E9|nr:cytochrome P450 [Hypoxylon trugodes]KAI1385039.1 cytochrome P450 [Hypoxylon trugodes]
MLSVDTAPTKALAIASLLVTVVYLYGKLYYKRFKQNAHLPQLSSSLLWGHLMAFDDFTKRGITDRHPDAIFADMYRALGQPPVMLLDNWPIVPPMVIVASHQVAEQLSKPSQRFNINERWKAVRKRFNPGFSPQHLLTLLPVILDKAAPYMEHIDEFVRTGHTFPLDQFMTNLTFNIIGAVAMDEDMSAQGADQGILIQMFKELIKTYADDKLQLPWWLIPRTHLRRRELGRRISHQLKAIVRRSFNDINEKNNANSRSILALSLQGIPSLTPEIIEETCDQLKTFLFAGHDTTSTTIIWCIYELTRTPHAMKSVHAELDNLFGPGGARNPTVVREKLLAPNGEGIIHGMTYISAVIKEVLRLHPPAGSIRKSEPGTGFTVSTPDGEYNLDGNWVYLNHTIIHRDRTVFGETADDFRPERWLQPQIEDISTTAWRPFERGPRNCIGQELANIETRVILAMLAQRYEFTKVGLGEFVLNGDDKGYYKAKSELYATIQITAKPVDGMLMKVKLAAAED